MADDSHLSLEAAQHYATGYEAARLTSSAQGELERVRSQEIIARYLPRPPARILDIGGAAGTYSLWLLDQGHEVCLIDALPLHAELAAQVFREHPNHQRASARAGDARSLAEEDRSADMVLLMGPLYHLTTRDDRLQALREAHRVLRTGGVVVAAVISRFASLLDGLARNLIEDPLFCEILKTDLATGQHRNPTNRPDYFTTAFFHRPQDLADEVRESRFALESILAVEGPAWLFADLCQRMNDAAKRVQLIDLLRSVESDPSLMGASAHLLAIGRKP